MKYSILIVTSCILLANACSSGDHPPDKFPDSSYQAISALGDTLYAPPLEPDTESRFKTELESSHAKYESNPGNAEAILGYGRETANMGNFRKAILIYSEGIENHPKDARFYRHRGHRYITIRDFDKAIDDLKRATELIYGSEDQADVNNSNAREEEQQSTLHASIWYHLGLAYYLKGEYDHARNAYEECLRLSTSDDTLVGASYWLYMSLRRAGKDDLAGKILEPISENMDLVENSDYHQLLLVFKGIFKADMLLEELRDSDSHESATLGYGLGNWHFINGRKDRAEELFHEVYEGGYWPAFGYIAAETDLKRLFEEWLAKSAADHTL